MKLEISTVLFSLIFICGMISCQGNLESCECEEINIYGHVSDIVHPISGREKTIRSGGVTRRIDDLDEINKIKGLMLQLNEEEKDLDGIDVMMVVDFDCGWGRKKTILLNSYALQNGKRYFDPTPELVDLLNGKKKNADPINN